VAALSGPGGATLRLFDALHGHLLLEEHLHAPEAGRLSDPALGSAVAFAPAIQQRTGLERPDVFVLSNGHEVRRLNGETGDLIWVGSGIDQRCVLSVRHHESGLNRRISSVQVTLTKILPTSTAIYLVGLFKGMNSYQLYVTSLSPSDGKVMHTVLLRSFLQDGSTDILVLSSSIEKPVVVWLEKGTVKSLVLTPELKEKQQTMKGAYASITDVGLSAHGQFIGIKGDGTGRLIKLSKDNAGLTAFWEFPQVKDAVGATYAGGFGPAEEPYVARVAWLESQGVAGVEVFGVHLADGQGAVTSFQFPFITEDHGLIVHAAFDVSRVVDGNTPQPRLLLTTTTGAIQMWDASGGAGGPWTREESLAYVSLSAFVDLPERQVLAAHGGHHEGYAARLVRHLKDAQVCPTYSALSSL
jgi:ER membrane protein complex subunit 1